MRAVLAVAAVLLAGAMVWLLTRPVAGPVPTAFGNERTPSAAEAVAATPAPAELMFEPEITRAAVPSEAERMRALLESVPHTSLRVRIEDPYGVLRTAPCTVALEVMMPTGRQARGQRAVDEKGECWFEILPAGECVLTLKQAYAAGVPGDVIHSQYFGLIADQPAIQSVDLSKKVVMVELQCANPPRGGLEAVELRQGSKMLAEWTAEDPAAGIQPGPLMAWAPVGAELEARFRTVDEEYVEKIKFHEPGRHTWLVEMPTGELQVHWPPSGGLDKFILESEPFPAGARNPSTCYSEAGRGSFVWLPRGRYVVRAGTVVRGKFLERARSPVEIGAEPVELTLVSAPAGSLRFTLPALPAEAPVRPPRGGKHRSTWPEAFLYPVGERWPVHGRKACSLEEDRFFADLLAGDYELVINQGDLSSITPVTVVAGVESLVNAREWVRSTELEVWVPGGGADAAPQVWLATGTGLKGRMEDHGLSSANGQRAWSYRAMVQPGAVRLILISEGGAQHEFGIVVADQAKDVHVIRVPK